MKKTITPGDGDVRHGTANGYGNLGCRCTACRGAWADYFASYASKPRVLAGNDPRHGTTNGYRYWHCRCVECLDAAAAEARDKRRRKREAR